MDNSNVKYKALEDKLKELKDDVKTLGNKVDDLTDMKLVLVELKTISKYTAQRLDKLEEAQDSSDDSNKITTGEIIKYVMFGILGVVISAVAGIIVK